MPEIPLIDVSGLGSPDRAHRTDVAHALGRACRDIGFFAIVGHDIPLGDINGIFDAAHQFFGQPTEFKARWAIERIGNNQGYVGLEVERLDETRPGDLKEAFNVALGSTLKEGDGTGPSVWPTLPGWRETVSRYLKSVYDLGCRLHRGLALDLGLPEDFFADKLDHPMATLRLLHYPPARANPAEGQTGAGTHTDYGNITILATDGVAGLEVRTRDGTWLKPPALDNAFICNIGDCLMRWTNDVYVSTPHRVAMPATDRYSVAFFLDANADALVEAVPSCVAAGMRPKYPPITAGAHITERLNATYLHRQAAG